VATILITFLGFQCQFLTKNIETVRLGHLPSRLRYWLQLDYKQETSFRRWYDYEAVLNREKVECRRIAR